MARAADGLVEGDRLDLSFDIREVIGKELEIFAYLARLGCVQEARKLYQEVLEPYQYQCFPILAEYLDMLMVIEDHDEILARFTGDNFDKFKFDVFTKHERMMLSNILGLASLRRLGNSNLVMSESKRSVSEWRFSLLGLERCTIGTSTNTLDAARFTIALNDLWSLSLESLPKLDQFYPTYERCCKHLNNTGRYWEARRLFQLFSQLDRTAASLYFDCFKNTIKPHLSRQDAKLAFLAVFTIYLPLLPETSEPGVEQMEGFSEDMQELLQYFFPEPSEMTGLHYDAWVACFKPMKSTKPVMDTAPTNSEPSTLPFRPLSVMTDSTLLVRSMSTSTQWTDGCSSHWTDTNSMYIEERMTGNSKRLQSPTLDVVRTETARTPGYGGVSPRPPSSLNRPNRDLSAKVYTQWYCCHCFVGPKPLLSNTGTCSSCNHTVCDHCKRWFQ